MWADVGSFHNQVGHGRKWEVAVGIASPALSVQKLFLLPVSWPTINHILSSCYRPMSGNAGSAICKSGVVENVGVAVGIASLSLSVQE